MEGEGLASVFVHTFTDTHELKDTHRPLFFHFAGVYPCMYIVCVTRKISGVAEIFSQTYLG